RRIGTLTLVRVPGPAYAEGEVELASELARRAALAVDNAARYASERETALVLQRSMLPELQPRARGLLVASRYLPGASGVDVGGDWYDLIPLSDPSRHGLVVGDVAGRGVAAAAVMGQLRAVVRAYALEGHPPARLLTQLDRFVDAQGMTPFVTCLYAIVDEREHTLTVSSAGHLPPLVLDGDGARLLPVAPGPPLGTRYGGYRDETFELAPDATVLLYTDGLVEERSRSITEGLERLRQAARHWRSSPEALCDGVLGELGRLGHQEDDTALLAVNLAGREPAPAPPVRSSIEVPAQDTSAAAARRWLERALDGAGGEELVATAALLTTELVANAVRHGGGRWLEVALALDDAAVRVEVADAGAGAPRPQAPPDPGVDSGRGLMIVEALAQRWGYEPDASGRGKRVWFELDR
ncbi:MAG TPA: ATP-binding SpoIIE family protein phosphatase, partial [Solirubrobacteraceae bacterium]